jgi:hypothetical protein
MPTYGRVPGVYGFRLEGVDDVSLLSCVAASAPTLRVSIEIGRAPDREESFGPDAAEIGLIDGGWVSLTRAGHAHFVAPRQIPSGELVHPWLVPAAATFSGWHGRLVLHGGGFSFGGQAIAILGNKEDGKSTLLAWLARSEDVSVLVDDLLVIESGSVLAGPRCIDLRPGTAEIFDDAAGHSVVRDASRLRMELPPCSPAAPLGALVVLSWSQEDHVSLRRLTASEGMAALLPHALNPGPNGRLLDLVNIPVWLLARPRTWSSLPQVADLLRDLADPKLARVTVA